MNGRKITNWRKWSSAYSHLFIKLFKRYNIHLWKHNILQHSEMSIITDYEISVSYYCAINELIIIWI